MKLSIEHKALLSLERRPAGYAADIIKRYVFMTCASLLVIPMQAQVISLDSVLALVDRNNPMLKEYDDKAKAFDEYAAGAKSWMAPMAGVGTFMTPYRRNEAMHDSDKGAWMFSIEQEIPNPAKLNANKNYLQSRGSIERQNRAVRFNALRAEARMLYYQWLVAEKKVSVLKDNSAVMALMRKLASIRYPYNQGSLGDVYMADARLSEIENMLLMTRGDVEEMSFRLKSLANLNATDSIMIDTSTVVSYESSLLVYDTATLSEQRSDVRQIDETIEVMRLNQQLQSFQRKPDFKIRFDHMEPIGNMPAQFSAMAMVSIPIAPWSSRMYKAEVKGMQHDINAMKRAREGILLDSRGALAGMGSKILRTQQLLGNYESKIIPALKKNYQTLMLAYEENREQLPTVIDAWEAMNMAQLEYLEKLNEYYTMIVNYEKELEK